MDPEPLVIDLTATDSEVSDGEPDVVCLSAPVVPVKAERADLYRPAARDDADYDISDVDLSETSSSASSDEEQDIEMPGSSDSAAASPTEPSSPASSGCDYYDEDPSQPVYLWTKANCHFSVEELTKLLVVNPVPKEKVCSKQPLRVCRNVAFVVDLHALDDPLDVRVDENGVWKRKGSPVTYVSVHKHSGQTRVLKRTKMGNHAHHYKVTRTYYRHASSPDFNRIITTVHDNQGQCQQFAFVQYAFDRQEHPIEIKPHGNSKGKKPFSRCKPSTLKLLKNSIQTRPPLQALQEVENQKGGVMGARSGCELPRNRKQVYNLKSTINNQVQGVASKAMPHSDVLAEVMLMCKDSSEQAYVRSVEAAPEPMCVLATDQQLADLERFCTGDPCSVASVDPTFNLGPFYVTPITYQNLLVETDKGHHPIVLGPVLIHKTKTFRPFHYFGSTLIRLNPRLINLKAFGTDGEPELIKAFNVAFPKAVHLRCTNHMRQNVKDKLHSLKIPKDIWNEFLADIFGKQTGSHLEMGLADAQSEKSFWEALAQLVVRWNNLERSCIPPGTKPQFHDWFCEYKAKDIVECVLPKVRAKAGIRNPDRKFTTNASEALNHVIKLEVSWKENKLPVLINRLESISSRHSAELRKAVVERGEWHFTSQYRHLQIPEASWFQMASGLKERHMRKVLSCKVTAMHSIDKHVRDSSASSLVDGPVSSDSSSVDNPISDAPSSVNRPMSDASSSINRPVSTASPSVNRPVLTASASVNHPVSTAFPSVSHQVSTASPSVPRPVSTGTSFIETPATSLAGPCGNPGNKGATSENTPRGILEVRAEDCGVTTISMALLKSMWNKAERLIRTRGDVLNVPWSSDRKARLIKSSSSDYPHLVTTKGTKNTQYSCDDKCPMFKGFSLCAHVVAAAHDNNDLRSFLQYLNQTKRGPNLSAIANEGMPTGTGRKGGVPKRKRNRATVPVETRSVRQCLQSPSHSSGSPEDGSVISVLTPPSSSYAVPTGSWFSSTDRSIPDTPPMTAGTHRPATLSSVGSASAQIQPFATSGGNVHPSAFNRLCSSMGGLASATGPVSQANTSSIGIVLGTNVSITTTPSTPVVSSPPLSSNVSGGPQHTGGLAKEPFILKFKTRQIKVCQACRRDYDGVNDTMGLVVARAERRMVSNLATGAQFLGRPSNSHYHAHMSCLRMACPLFRGSDLVVPDDLKYQLTAFQKIFLTTCLQVPL